MANPQHLDWLINPHVAMNKILPRMVPLVVLIVVFSASACGLTNQETAPTRKHLTAEQFYNTLKSELKSNPTRLKSRVGQELRPFEGAITKIEGASIQFRIDKRFLRRDHYITCTFRSNTDVIPLNNGDYVAVQGVLEEAFPSSFMAEVGAVKLRNCRQVDR